jgi:hypothetical protein
MRIAFSFYGIVSGERPSHVGGPIGSDRDIRHCWPNIQKMLIDPFKAQGHETEIYFSTYNWNDDVDDYIRNVINPNQICLSDKNGSDPFTTKRASFFNLKDRNVDMVVLSRCDVHYSKIIANESIDFEKFNFLFPEGGGWWERYNFTCDNFYIFPYAWYQSVENAMIDTYPGYPRGYPMVDTHGLWLKLRDYIPENLFHIISKEPDRFNHIHPEVKERFYNEI